MPLGVNGAEEVLRETMTRPWQAANSSGVGRDSLAVTWACDSSAAAIGSNDE